MGLTERGWASWLRDGLALMALILAILIAYEGMLNRSLQDRVEAGRTALVRGQTFANLDNGLIQVAAKTASEKNDPELRALLAQNGVTFQVQPGVAPGPKAGNTP